MSKAEKFIQENTKALKDSNGKEYFMWISQDQARKAVEIAMEEMIEKVYAAFCKTCKLNCNCNHRECYYLNNFKQAMKDE